jgi:hypothetical protein
MYYGICGPQRTSIDICNQYTRAKYPLGSSWSIVIIPIANFQPTEEKGQCDKITSHAILTTSIDWNFDFWIEPD